jgi:hypothetical protein
MWGLYARDEGAVCVRSTVGSLKRALHHDGAKREVYIASVRYIDYTTDEIPMNNLLQAFWTKRLSFEHEREVRAILPEEQTDLGVLVNVDLDILLDMIHVNPTATPWIKDSVADLAARYGIAAEVRQSSLATDPIT